MDSMEAFAGTYSEKLADIAMQKRIPLSGTFELLPSCNMRCKMCYIQHAPKNEELQPAEFWLNLFEMAIREGMLFALITGGEPLLYPEFDKLYEKTAQMPAYVCVNTNATLLDRERVKMMAKLPPRRLNISVYGSCNETYASLCGNPNGFTQVINALDLLKEHQIPFRIHSVMTPENVADYQGIVDICKKYEAPNSIAHYMFPPYRRECGAQADTRLTPALMAANMLRDVKMRYGDWSEGYREYVRLRCVAMENPQICSLYGEDTVSCKAGRCTFWVDWRGNISNCGVCNQNAIDLHTAPFSEAWKRVVADTEEIRISQKCKTCKYRCFCPICPAAGFCETGFMDGTPEYLCAFAEEYGKLLMAEKRRLLRHE